MADRPDRAVSILVRQDVAFVGGPGNRLIEVTVQEEFLLQVTGIYMKTNE